MKETRTISFVIKWFVSHIMKHKLPRVLISIFILSTTIAFFSLIWSCLYFDKFLSFQELVTRAGISIASKELTTLLISCIGGGSGGLLALVIASLLRFLGQALFIENFMMPEGTAGSNSASGTPAEILPDLNQPAPALTDAELAQETEANASECARILSEICEEAKTLARNAGVTDPDKLSNIEDAVKYLADVEELDEETRIPALLEFKESLHKKETWVKIDKECKRWGGG